MKNLTKSNLKSYFLIGSILLNFIFAPSIQALKEKTWDTYDLNNIFYYNPDGENCTTSSSSITSGSNQLYSGDAILDQNSFQKITKNQPFYESSAKKYNLPWQLLAALHFREAGANRYNPNNGQGVYQLYSYTAGGTNENAFKPAGEISDAEFQRQTDIVADLVKNNYGANLNFKAIYTCGQCISFGA